MPIIDPMTDNQNCEVNKTVLIVALLYFLSLQPSGLAGTLLLIDKEMPSRQFSTTTFFVQTLFKL